MNIAVILISGSGKRFGGETPKQFLLVNHRPVYLYTVDRFYHSEHINRVVLVTSKDNLKKVKEDLTIYHFKGIDVIEGGSERYLSVINAIKYISSFASDEDKILIHDGVRANVTDSIILDNINGLDSFNAVLTAIEGDYEALNKPRIDTLHKKNNKLYLAQTPQSFRLGYINELISLYKNEPVTDEIKYVEANNDEYLIINGDPLNYKITEPKDFDRFVKNIKPIKKYKVYLFDFDGTLIDSRDSLYLVYKKAFDAVGESVSKEETNIFMKESIEKTFLRKLPKYEIEQLLLYKKIINSYINSEEVTHENKLFYDTLAMLDYIKENNLLSGLVSGNDSTHMKEVLSFLKIDPATFLTFIGHGEVKKFKPDPEGILLALKQLNYTGPLTEVCYVGDSMGDMMAAFNAGIDAYLVDRYNDYPLSNNYTKVNSLLDLVI